MIRPKVGAGIAIGSTSYTGCPPSVSCSTPSETKPLIAPGSTFLVLPKSLSISIDLRLAMVLAERTPKALIFGLGIGF